MNCPREHCGGLLLEMDDKWMKCSACARPITKAEAHRLNVSNNHKEDPMGATWTPERTRKFKATMAAKRREREAAAAGGGTSKPSPAPVATRGGRRPKAATAGSNGHGDALNNALLAVIEQEEQQLTARLDKLKHVKEAIAAL